MIGALGGGERGEVKGVDDWLVQQRGSGEVSFDEAAVVGNEIVADYEFGAAAEFVELAESVGGACGVSDSQPLVSEDGADVTNAPLGADLEIKRQAALKETGQRQFMFRCFRNSVAVYRTIDKYSAGCPCAII